VTLDDWPLFGLEIATPRVVLRAPRDDDFPGLLAAIDAGVHDPTTMPFLFPSTDADPATRRRDDVAETIELRLTRERWDAMRPDIPITVRGFELCRAMFGPAQPEP
jgi:hypothetical protein